MASHRSKARPALLAALLAVGLTFVGAQPARAERTPQETPATLVDVVQAPALGEPAVTWTDSNGTTAVLRSMTPEEADERAAVHASTGHLPTETGAVPGTAVPGTAVPGTAVPGTAGRAAEAGAVSATDADAEAAAAVSAATPVTPEKAAAPTPTRRDSATAAATEAYDVQPRKPKKTPVCFVAKWYAGFENGALTGYGTIDWCAVGEDIVYFQGDCWGAAWWPTYAYFDCDTQTTYGVGWSAGDIRTSWHVCLATIVWKGFCAWDATFWDKYRVDPHGRIWLLGRV